MFWILILTPLKDYCERETDLLLEEDAMQAYNRKMMGSLLTEQFNNYCLNSFSGNEGCEPNGSLLESDRIMKTKVCRA